MRASSRFYSSVGLLMILNLVIKPLWIFGIDRQVQNAVGTEEYGTYFSLLNFSIVFRFLLDWGLTNYFNRQLAVSPEKFIGRAGSILLLKLLLSLLYAAVVIGTAFLSGVRQWEILFVLILIQLLTSLFLFFRGLVTALQWFRTEAWLSVLDKTVMIILCGSFLYFPALAGDMTITRFLWIQVIATSIAVFVVLVILVKKDIRWSFPRHSIFDLQLFKAALPFGLIILLMSAHFRLDGFLLERLHPNGAYEAGLYAGAYRLLDAANMVGFLLATFLLPFMARRWSEGKKIDELTLNSRHLLLLFSAGIIMTVVFLAPWLQQVLYQDNNAAAITILQWCLPALAGYSLVQVYGTVMTATGQVLPFCLIIFLSVVLNVVLNLLLIPGWGAQGCCIAALVSQGFCGITAMVFVQKRTGIIIHARSLLMYIFIAGLLAGFYYMSREWNTSPWLLMTGATLITITAALVLKLIDWKSWQTNSK
jgi:O-antigen/teichoic acid export membrane protein